MIESPTGSRSPLTRSRSRRQQFNDDELKPLLANLSPSSTLNALVATSAVSTIRDRSHSFVEASVANASESERAWGIKAALVAKKIREWHDDLHAWCWSSGTLSDKNGFLETRDVGTIQQYQDRIEIIRDDMDTLEVEELKNHVREAHAKSTASQMGTLNIDHMDDFTAIITATIVQSLPTLSRLNSMLETWSIRLVILHRLPSFLSELKGCQESMLSAWMAIGQADRDSIKLKPEFSRTASAAVQAVLQDQITELAKMLDGMLDLLEGSQDVLPEEWVDGMDKLENEYSSWVVSAEELILNNEMEVASRESRAKNRPTGGLIIDGNLAALDAQPASVQVENSGNVDGAMDRLASVLLAEESPSLGELAAGPGGLESVAHHRGAHPPHALLAPSSLPELRQDPTPNGPIAGVKTYAGKRMPPQKPPPLQLDRSSADQRNSAYTFSDADSDISRSGSATSDYFSNKSSPEILSASVATYPGSPVKITTPAWASQDSVTERISRPSSLFIQREGTSLGPSHPRAGLRPSLNRRERAMTSPPGALIFQTMSTESTKPEVPALSFGHTRVRSASLRSFEKVPTGNVRKLMVRRSGGYASIPVDDNNPNLQHYAMEFEVPLSLPDSGASAVDLTTSQPSERSGAKRFHREIRPLLSTSQQTSGSPSRSERLRNDLEDGIDLAVGSKPITVRKQRHTQAHPAHIQQTPARALTHVTPKHKDNLDARISSILTNIPADIRLTSSSAATPPPSRRPRNNSNPTTPLRRSLTPKLLRSRTPTASPSLTLAPAAPSADPKSSPSVTSSINSPEIRLYHLHRSDKDSAPVKLYVRLVGDTGERVMVRVGGGWADLGEYLREYALHHGKRSISANGFDIQNLPRTTSISPAGSSQGMPGPESRSESPVPASRNTPVIIHNRSYQTPPSRPGSSGEDRSSPNAGVSLAGLKKAKNVDISPRKQMWVHGMLEQARSQGAGSVEKTKRKEKRKSDGGGLGFLGRVGASNRVFLRRGEERFVGE